MAHTFGGSSPRSGGSVALDSGQSAGFAGLEHMAKQNFLHKSRDKMRKQEKLALELHTTPSDP